MFNCVFHLVVFFLKSYALGIDIGGTNTKFSLVDAKGETIESQHFRTEASSTFSDFVGRLKAAVYPYLERHGIDKERLPVGIGLPNYSSKKNKLIAPPNLNWEAEFSVTSFQEIFPGHLKLENDANVAAIGEKTWGQARGCSDFVSITVGTGIGSGIFCNNQLLTGASGIAGEAGHIIVDPNGNPCKCGGRGHFESHCSVRAIKEQTKQNLGNELSYHQIVEQFKNEDPQILKIFQETALYFAIGLQLLMAILSPQKIILSGGGMVVGERYLDMIKSALIPIAYQPSLNDFELLVSKLSVADGAILGAAAMVISDSVHD